MDLIDTTFAKIHNIYKDYFWQEKPYEKSVDEFYELKTKIQTILKIYSDESIPLELQVKPANDGYYYLRNLKDNKDYDLETYAAKFTKLCYPDIECVCKAIDTQDYYLLDECGNYDYINTEEWSIILTDPEEYRRKVLNNEFVKFKKL